MCLFFGEVLLDYLASENDGISRPDGLVLHVADEGGQLAQLRGEVV